MKNYLVFIMIISGLIIICNGCKVKYLQPERTTETIVEYKEVIRDTTIYIPADSSTVTALLECDSLNNVYIKSILQYQGEHSRIGFNANHAGKTLYITTDCICDSMGIYLTYKDIYHKEKVIEKEVVRVVEKKNCNVVRNILIGVGIGLLVSGLILLYKNKFKIF